MKCECCMVWLINNNNPQIQHKDKNPHYFADWHIKQLSPYKQIPLFNSWNIVNYFKMQVHNREPFCSNAYALQLSILPSCERPICQKLIQCYK